MLAHSLADALGEEDLRAQELRIGIKVADRAIDDRAAGDRPEPPSHRLALERPRRQPVDAAHVSAKERRHCAQSRIRDSAHDGIELTQRVGTHRGGLGLKHIPHEEEADDVES